MNVNPIVHRGDESALVVILRQPAGWQSIICSPQRMRTECFATRLEALAQGLSLAAANGWDLCKDEQKEMA